MPNSWEGMHGQGMGVQVWAGDENGKKHGGMGRQEWARDGKAGMGRGWKGRNSHHVLELNEEVRNLRENLRI